MDFFNLRSRPFGYDPPLLAPPSPPPGLTDPERDLRRGHLGVVAPQIAPPLAAVAEVGRDAEEGGPAVRQQGPRRRIPGWDPLQPQVGGKGNAQAAGQVGRLAGDQLSSRRGDDWGGGAKQNRANTSIKTSLIRVSGKTQDKCNFLSVKPDNRISNLCCHGRKN